MKAWANPWTIEIVKLLDDDEWHSMAEILALAMPLVPPNRAWRSAESARLSSSRTKTPKDRVKTMDKAAIIRVGQRIEVVRSLANLRVNGRVEVEYQFPELKRKITRVRTIRRPATQKKLAEERVWKVVGRENPSGNTS